MVPWYFQSSIILISNLLYQVIYTSYNYVILCHIYHAKVEKKSIGSHRGITQSKWDELEHKNIIRTCKSGFPLVFSCNWDLIVPRIPSKKQYHPLPANLKSGLWKALEIVFQGPFVKLPVVHAHSPTFKWPLEKERVIRIRHYSRSTLLGHTVH